MHDYLAEVDRLLELLSLRTDVLATALTAGQEYLVLYDGDDLDGIIAAISGANVVHSGDAIRGDLVERKYSVFGIDTTFLFGCSEWASIASADAQALEMARQGLFEIHDPHELVRQLQSVTGCTPPGFASTAEIDRYGDISSDFFRLVGLGEASFISDDSTLLDWCQHSGIGVDDANRRIHEIYGVDVRDLNGGRLVDVFNRIRDGDRYKEWRKQNPKRSNKEKSKS
jgi:PAS domain-containing protein